MSKNKSYTITFSTSTSKIERVLCIDCANQMFFELNNVAVEFFENKNKKNPFLLYNPKFMKMMMDFLREVANIKANSKETTLPCQSLEGEKCLK